MSPTAGFLRINTRGHWPGSFALSTEDHEFLDHDSFLECGGLVEFDEYSVGQALAEDGRNPIGSLPSETVEALIEFIPTVKQLTKTQQDVIVRELTKALSSDR